MASSNTTLMPSHSHIYFRYQSGNITLTEWVTLLTLCLAPLVTHIAFGYGNVVLLSERRPNLLDQLTQFNPITIVWRYHAIVNRRLRARDWDRADMAASNVIFWDGHRWDGSEHLMLSSRQWVTKLPPRNRVNWISSSTLATLAMTIQGVGAAGVLIRSPKNNWQSVSIGLPTVFNSFALLSFSRLYAFLWLSDENGFEALKRQPLLNSERIADPTDICIDSTASLVYHSLQMISSGEFSEATSLQDCKSRLYPTSTLGARLWLVWSVVSATTVAGGGIYLSVTGISPRPFVVITGLSTLCSSLYWLVFCASLPLIFVYYFFKQQAGNTALPCMNSTWYKCLNLLMILLAFLMFVTNALETKILPNGKTAKYPIPPP